MKHSFNDPSVLRLFTVFGLLLAGCPSDSQDALDTDGTTSGGSSSVSSGSSSTTTTSNPTTDSSASATSTSGADDSSSSSEGVDDESSTTDDQPSCGDGVVDADEACDDGNDNDNDACSIACEVQWASGNDGDCTPAMAVPCDYHGAQCRLSEDGSDAYCYWPAPTDEAGCDESPGIWTPSDGGFAMDHPEMQFPAEGACITQAANLRCEAASTSACDSAGADLCTPSLDSSGTETTGPEICFWAVDEAGCDATSGIWTTPSDGFAMTHPNALPPDTAACITQVTNL